MLRDGLSGPIHDGALSPCSSAARFTATLDGVLRAFLHAAEFFDPSPEHSAGHDLQHPSEERGKARGRSSLIRPPDSSGITWP